MKESCLETIANDRNKFLLWVLTVQLSLYRLCILMKNSAKVFSKFMLNFVVLALTIVLY